jgi:hypothetical protein
MRLVLLEYRELVEFLVLVWELVRVLPQQLVQGPILKMFMLFLILVLVIIREFLAFL